MTDIIIVICCILGGFAVGKFIENQFRSKGRFYQDLTRYLSLLKDNIRGRQLELDKFNAAFASTCSRPFCDYLTSGKFHLKLNKSQRDHVEAFFNNLNCTSSQALIEHIEYYGKILSDEAKFVWDNEVVKSSIYTKLGMLLGAMLGILLI